MNQPVTPPDQHTLWNGTAAQAWIDEKEVLDRMFQPFEDLLVERTLRSGARAVLDVGCGTGGTTLAIAQRLGTQARCTGIDISEPMLAVARERAAAAGLATGFVAADLQQQGFAPDSFDRVVSRFGVMFFDDPATAFSNLHRSMRSDATLCCIAWRSPAENPFMTTAERAAAPLLPGMPARRAGAPGQFAFADPQHVEKLLQRSGWQRISITPLDVSCRFPADKLHAYLTRLGPLGLVLQSLDEAMRRRLVEVVRAAFEPFVHGDEVRFDAACWCIEASA